MDDLLYFLALRLAGTFHSRFFSAKKMRDVQPCNIAPVSTSSANSPHSLQGIFDSNPLALVARPVPAEVAECFHLGTGHQRLDRPPGGAGSAPLYYFLARN